MKTKAFLLASFCLALQAATALAGPDQFIGDAAIYNALATNTIRPNILLIVDNSNVTLNSASGTKYDPSVNYCGTYGGAACTYSRYSVYKAGQQGDFSTTSVVDNSDSNLTNITCNNNNNVVINTLLRSGSYIGSATSNYPNLKKIGGSGTVGCDTTGGGATYALGNFLNYTRSSAGATSDSQRKVVYDAIQTVVDGARYAVNFGAMVYGGNNSGGKVVYQVGDLTNDTSFNNFLSVLPGVDGSGALTGESVLSSQTARPQAESLLDAGHYFWGLGLPVSGQAAMPSPIKYSCDKNHVIIITNGLSNKDDSPKLASIVGDFDNDGAEAVGYGNGGSHYLDDVAKYLYQHPASVGQRVVTNTILAFQADDELVRRAADGSHGRGSYQIAANANELAAALTKLLNNIMVETNTSFVAPVVPVSPENRTFSGSRVYMGFFKPISGAPWHGNLKKYAINSLNALTDKNNSLACYTDNNKDAIDDLDQASLPSGAVNGSFRNAASSFWSSGADGGTVEAGGAGEVLYNRTLASNPRKIYTYTGSNSNLTDASNAFSTANGAISAAALSVADAATKDTLINYLHGYDVYDENGNGDTTEKRGWTSTSSTGWVLGDILHSRPLIVNYATYDFTAGNEANCSTNKSIVYVGANDGMLHAIKDCDGSEVWSFIPPNMLGNLVELTQTGHSYFVDSTPSVYSYDANNDGIINTANGDKVILMFGERRGGGADTAPTSGSYHALDVSDPATPRLLWRISNQSSGFSELAETWSEPKLVKMRVNTGSGSVDRIVAFVGAGYDNIHEDTRFGNKLAFSNSATVFTTDIGSGDTASGGSIDATALTNPKGRGVYAIEIAALSAAGVPSFTNSGAKLWGYVYGAATNEAAVPPASSTNSLLKYSIPSELSAVDSNNDGYTDTLYVGDTGGQVWKFNVGDTLATNWRGIRLFNLNSGTASVGKKFFYKPSVVVEPGYTMLFIGSGDREHPLNRDTTLIDRMYALKDRGQTTADNRSEADLTDVTSDLIQTTSATSGTGSIPGILAALSASYGWYISLDLHVGEKVLAAPTIFNKVSYFTTFAPNPTVSVDPCNPGNLGISRLYAVDYKNGGSVLNYDTTNDGSSTSNPFAKSTPGQVLVRSDRETTLGNGIASGIVMLITPGGGLRALIGVGGVIAGEDPKKGGSVLPLYWRQK